MQKYLNIRAFKVTIVLRRHIKILLWLSIISNTALAQSAIANADKYFASGNMNGLSQIYNRNKSNRGIAYLYAKAQLNKNVPSAAEQFVENNFNDYMRNDILHQLLSFYYTNKNYLNYQRVFRLLPDGQRTTNERCGMNTIMGTMSVDAAYIAINNPPVWCVQVLSSAYIKRNISKEQRNWMLYNLIANDKTNEYNEVAGEQGLRTINFAIYRGKPTNKIPANDFLIINRITTIGHRNPDQALDELKRSNISEDANTFLNNYLAMQFAQKHNFKQALSLYEKYGDNLSDDEAGWLARSYLYSANWKRLISTIDNMSKGLRAQNIWLYWKAMAYQSLNNSAKAMKYFKLISKDYSYYAMLAGSELGTGTIYNVRPPKTTTLDNSNEAKIARIGFDLYREGRNNNLRHLETVGMAQWNYAARAADNDNLLIAMSNLAKQSGYYDLSIYAANQMESRYIELSFPLPFWPAFIQYSKLFGIDPTYTLAVSRQESRFNYQVIAFDGGVGLMQIMPQTAQYISHKASLINCYRKGPECNIKFGSWYLSSLYNKFGNLIYSTAAYNAGPNRPKRWQDSLGNLDNRVQIELIPINITRDYVQKVLSNKAIYDSEIAGTNKIDFANYIYKIGKHHYLNILDDDNTDAGKL